MKLIFFLHFIDVFSKEKGLNSKNNKNNLNNCNCCCCCCKSNTNKNNEGESDGQNNENYLNKNLDDGKKDNEKKDDGNKDNEKKDDGGNKDDSGNKDNLKNEKDDNKNKKDNEKINKNGDISDLIDAINEYRKEEGKEPFVEDENLNEAAKVQADFMAEKNNVTHEGPPGDEDLKKRVNNQGGDGSTARENVAQTNDDYINALNLWKESQGHNENLLSDSKKCGVAQANGENGEIFVAQVSTN